MIKPTPEEIAERQKKYDAYASELQTMYAWYDELLAKEDKTTLESMVITDVQEATKTKILQHYLINQLLENESRYLSEKSNTVG